MFNVKRGDITAFTFLTVAVMVIFMFETIIVKPYLDEQGYTYVNFHLCIGLMILFNVYASLYRLVSTDTSTVGLVMPSTRPNSGDWRYCLVCEANSPPRAYHCRNCDRCILRRDHHCIFSACCVGHKNYKFYMGLLFQVALGSVYAFAFHRPYIWANMGGLSLINFFSHLIPIPFYLFGYIDRWTMLCNFLSMLSIIGALFSTGLFAYHFNLLVKNQTTFERQKGITEYSLGSWRLNLLECLGPRWPLTVFVTPLLDSKLPGDGIHFAAKSSQSKYNVKEDKYSR